MAFLKSYAGHVPCVMKADYFMFDAEGRMRALWIDTRMVRSWWRWADEMDDMRKAHGCYMRGFDGRGRSREYYHFIVSPDERDAASLEQVRELALRWLDENLPDAQAVVIYHDDNKSRLGRGEQGIVHAHVMVNALHPVTLKKLQISDRDVDAMADSLQRMSKDLGLSHFDNSSREYKRKERGQRQPDGTRATSAERRITERGGYSWKNELSEVVKATAPFCTDFHDLQRHLAPYGFGIRRVAGDLLFINPEGRKVRGAYLGLDCERDHLKRFFADVSFTQINASCYSSLRRELQVKSGYIAVLDPTVKDLQDKLDLVGIMEREGIERLSDFDKRKKELRAFGAAERIELYKLRAEVAGSIELFDAAQIVIEQGRTLETGGGEQALAGCGTGYLDAERILRERGVDPADAQDVVRDLRPTAMRYLAKQAVVEGTAQRLEDLGHAHWLAQKVLVDCLMSENLERERQGLPPKKPPTTRVTAPPKEYSAKGSPYWKLNISAEQYQKIKDANREARSIVARTQEPSGRRLPPYVKKRDQVRNSLAAERKAREISSCIGRKKDGTI